MPEIRISMCVRSRLLRWLAVATLAIAAGGCATPSPTDPAGGPVTDVLPAFERGEIRLTCGLGCAFQYGGFRKLHRARYEQGQWKDLALHVAQLGYNIDQSYFYLGRAAEGLGHVKAARTYYELAIASRAKCGRVFDTCDGFVLPDDAVSRLRGLPPG